MKNVFYLVLALAGILTCINLSKSDVPESMNGLLLENVEALAQGIEDDDIPYECIDYGEVDCPDGVKVEYVFSGYSLRHKK